MDDFKVPTLPMASVKAEDANAAKEAEKTESVPQKQQQPSEQQTEPQENDESPKKSSEAVNDALTCPYRIPPWSAAPPAQLAYKFEVLKSGQIIEEVPELQRQAIWKFGRLPANDVAMAHPTISRFHAVLQYRPKMPPQLANSDGEEEEKAKTVLPSQQQQPAEGWYIYDLNSTHGTFLNKQKVPARVFIRVRVGHMLKLGASSRSYILAGPDEDAEPESELSVTELRAQRQQQAEEAVLAAQRKTEEAEERKRNEGISWGMQEDADEETDLTHNPYAATNNEELFLDDPKRTLRGYFEREGLDLEYKCDEMSAGSFVCRVELPLDDANGRPLIAEVVHKGRKKECVVQCALEACRILDRHGVLRQANQEPLKRKLKTQDSDSDGDEFWDRTGDVLRKKQRKANSGVNVTLTYDDLLKEDAELTQQLKQVDADIAKYQETQKRLKETKAQQEQEDVELDSFMEKLGDGATQLDKTEIRKLRLEQQRLKAEAQKLQRLIKIAKPIDLPFAKAPQETTGNERELVKLEVPKKQLPMVGKRNQFSKFKVVKMPTITTATKSQIDKSNVFDEEDLDEGVKLEQKSEEKEEKSIAEAEVKEILEIESTHELSTTEVQVKNYGPAVVPQNVLENKPKNGDSKDNMEVDSPATTTNEITEVDNKEVEVESNVAENDKKSEEPLDKDEHSKKRRQRQRLRHKRHEADNDELDAHESSEKYAKWVPPANQSGDGYTKLNDKYGY